MTPEPRDAELMAADVLIHATLARTSFPPPGGVRHPLGRRPLTPVAR
jgi:hypothetical protein